MPEFVQVASSQKGMAWIDSVTAHFPSGTTGLRACKQCRWIMQKKQFIELGCPQCPDFMMKDNEPNVLACTTENFYGFFAMFRPGSFATRFTGLENSMPGMYALHVHGEIPPEMALGRDRQYFLPTMPQNERPDDLSSLSGMEDELWGAGSRDKKRKADQIDTPTQPDAVANALAVFNESGSDADEAESDEQRAAARQQVIVSGTSASETGVSGKKSRSNVPSSSAAESAKSHPSMASGTSRGSVAILEPEVDAEFEDR